MALDDVRATRLADVATARQAVEFVNECNLNFYGLPPGDKGVDRHGLWFWVKSLMDGLAPAQVWAAYAKDSGADKPQ